MTKIPSRHAPTVGSRSFFPLMIGALLLCIAVAVPAARASDPPAEGPISSVSPLLLENFSIFRTPSEVVPPEIAEGVEKINATNPPVKTGPFAGGRGFNVALAQEVVLPGNHAPLWAVPGRDQVMLFDQPRNGHFGGSSTTIARAVKEGIIGWTGVPRTHQPHLVRVRGLVPDGVTAIRLSKTAVAPVVGNAFTRKVSQSGLWEAGRWEDKHWIFIRGGCAKASTAAGGCLHG